ncbi:MAG TPA: hypothetical protein VHV08_07400, partial [Pirellulales bacterium]|nr:hypothetical protein [Pirellulales bacterium]
MSKKHRIAVFAHSLHGRRPRGFQRVSRALTEALLEQAPADVEFRCLLHKSDQQYELTYNSCDLREWLAQHPLVIPEAGGSVAKLK